MGLSISIFLMAVGAILTFAVTTAVEGINLAAAGVVLMAVGGLGVILSLIFWSSWGGRRRVVVREEPGVRRTEDELV